LATLEGQSKLGFVDKRKAVSSLSEASKEKEAMAEVCERKLTFASETKTDKVG
jgi:hypothetical protein